MYYESSDFLETADSDTLKQIVRTRELTRKYYFSDYGDTEKSTSILRELLGGIGENVAIDTPFHCDYVELEPKLESVVNLVVCDVVECAANGRDVVAEYHARLVDDVYAPVIEHTAAVLFYASPVGGNTAASVNS